MPCYSYGRHAVTRLNKSVGNRSCRKKPILVCICANLKTTLFKVMTDEHYPILKIDGIFDISSNEWGKTFCDLDISVVRLCYLMNLKRLMIRQRK